jgi:ribosomal protein S11
MPAAKTTDKQVLTKLRRRKTPATAAQLGTTAAKLKRMAGVEVVGTAKSGGRGRPALLFAASQED